MISRFEVFLDSYLFNIYMAIIGTTTMCYDYSNAKYVLMRALVCTLAIHLFICLIYKYLLDFCMLCTCFSPCVQELKGKSTLCLESSFFWNSRLFCIFNVALLSSSSAILSMPSHCQAQENSNKHSQLLHLSAQYAKQVIFTASIVNSPAFALPQACPMQI